MKKVLLVSVSRSTRGKVRRFCEVFKKNLKGVSIKELDLTKKVSQKEIQNHVLECDGMFIATYPSWFSPPVELKAFIEALDPIDDKLWVKERLLGLAVHSPQGGELGIFTSVVAPLTLMGFSLIGNGYAYHRGTKFDEGWAWDEVKEMGRTFTEKLIEL